MALVLAALACLALFAAALGLIRALFALRRRSGAQVVAFFHPYCHSGGGGERVLWCAIKALLDRYGRDGAMHLVVYTGDIGVSKMDIFSRASSRFNLDLPPDAPIEFVYLRRRHLVEAARWPRFTMLGQSLGSMVLAAEALWKCCPHVFVDTTGYAFSYPIARLAGATVISYTHYPTISTDMLSRVRERRPDHNNATSVASSSVASSAKLAYYAAFALAYGLVGRCADLVMVNSTWTRNHINSLWRRPATTHVVFPPCNTGDLQRAAQRAAAKGTARHRVAMSVGQFRPEKDHPLQLRALAELHKRGGHYAELELVLVGSCRDAEDEERIRRLRGLARELRIAHAVRFVVNASYATLREHLLTSLIGLHTMWNEHFGIGVVEMMAAGVVTIAHNSGGPREDIVLPVDGVPSGYLATTPEEYADAMAEALDGCPGAGAGGVDAVRAAAAQQAARFPEPVFMDRFGTLFDAARRGAAVGN